MSTNQPYSIKIFLPGGDPDGLRIIEKSGWSGSGLVVPRSLFAEAKQRKELGRTGVYVLVGPPEESGLPRIYVGEGDPIRPRLESHAGKKDFWTSCIAFSSKDENLNKAHVQYLEARLITLAKKAKRCTLENSNEPQMPSLSEADAADAEGFLKEMMLCFPLLGVPVFTAATAVPKAGIELVLKAKGIQACGMETSQGFLVRGGSVAAQPEVPSCPEYLREIRTALLANGVLQLSEKGYLFTQDYLFSSPSNAAGTVLARSANGLVEWKTKNGKTLKALRSDRESS